MNRNARLLSIAFVLLGAGLQPAVQAQTPVPKVPPNLTIKWLNTLTVSPATTAAGTNITGTVKLMRPAVGDLRVGLILDGARLDESGIWVLNGVIVPAYVTVPDRGDRATFTVRTSGSVTWIGSRTFTLKANYVKESLSTSFSVNRIATR